MGLAFILEYFGTGLALFSCMPTTLSSGVALTQLVGGNSALALTMTVISNLLGIITVPFWISKLLAAGFGVSIPVRQLFWNLTLMLLVPLLFGKVARNSIKGLGTYYYLIGLGTYVDQNRKIFTTTSIILLSLTPWMQVSKARHLLLAVKVQVFIKAIAMGM
ncbi:unnamed protein product [Linum tenue]|uniref:Uncharacterized protein n=1 Tax=Linum tenue TaxID=586396 RepID=A0AAV0QFM4_9ROSI|nr:unnamed protein product [Linum tenue]